MTSLQDRPAPLSLADPGPFTTVPNLVTIVRTLLAVGIGAVGVAQEDLWLLAAAYAVYWLGDMADGWLARRLVQETRAGAVLDIVCDRACTSVLCVGLVAHLPEVTAVVIVFLLSFMVLDTMLSLAFLCWPLLSPNDFHQVDQRVWAWNWSPAAKAANTAGVVLAVALGLPEVALLLALVVVLIKVVSAHHVVRLLAPV